jgi:hypothetical protein
MRHRGLLLAILLVATACGSTDNGSARDPSAAQSSIPSPSGPTIEVRVTGSLEEGSNGWVLCPGSVGPCWMVLDGGGLSLTEQQVVADGIWQADTIRISSLAAAPELTWDFPDPCATEDDPKTPFDQDALDRDPLNTWLDTLSDLAATWLTRDQQTLVVVVTGDLDRHRDEVEWLGLDGVCVADLGFEHTMAELESAQGDLAERWREWDETGWIATSLSIDVLRNEVVARFDQIDPRLRSEVETRWGDMVRIEAAVEVLDGTVDDLAMSVPDDQVAIATQPRGASGMDALGTFVVRYDAERDCLWFEGHDGNRIKPIWPFGTRALREPMVVLDGRGGALAAVGQEVTLGGGFGDVLPDADDPTDCGAEQVWAVSSFVSSDR